MIEKTASQEVEIRNKLGLHARAASLIVKLSSKFKSEIYIEKEGIRVNGKSIMGILMLAATRRSRLLIQAYGEDAREAVLEIAKLVEIDKFNEE